MSKNSGIKNKNHILSCGNINLDLTIPKVMGILNVTPDSFFDGGQYKSDAEILKKVEMMISEGASIIDIGGISTRPGSQEVDQNTELKRTLPILTLISQKFPDAILSVDTYRSEVAKHSLTSGAHIINDISGGQFDNRMFNIVAEHCAPYILMHIKGQPQTMQQNPKYSDPVIEINEFFIKQLKKLEQLGVTSNIVLDPGFGFGKNLKQNYELLYHLRQFESLGYPILAGVSRKSMINKVLDTIPEQALNGTTILNTIALLNGAKILRVHDVKEAKQAIKLVLTYNSSNS